jgi:hypothetical protein
VIARRLAPEGGQPPSRKEKISVALRTLSIEEAKFTLILEGEDGGETLWRIDPFTIRLSGIGGARNDFEIETRIDGAVRGEIVLGPGARQGTAVPLMPSRGRERCSGSHDAGGRSSPGGAARL